MRIAFVVNSFPPRLGGLEQHLDNLTSGLVGLGHTVKVLTISNQVSVREEHGVEVLTGCSHLPIEDVVSFPSMGAIAKISRYLRREEIEVVSTHTRFFPMSYVGLRAARKAGVPTVHTEHGSGFVESPSPVIAMGSRIVDLTMGRYVLANSDRVLAVSSEAAAFASRLGRRDVSVFHNAITPPVSGPDVPDRPGHLVFVGRLVAGKGWGAFLGAVDTLRRQGVPVEGELIGGGPDLESVRQRVDELGLQGAVQVRGRVSPLEVRSCVAGGTLVNPTVLSEGFQTTMLEALAERGRVVTYDVSGARLLRESGFPVVVTDQRTPEALAATLYEALTNPPPLAPRSAIEAWTWPQRVREYSDILADVV